MTVSTGGATESELTEHVLPLVYELHKVTPTMLAYILPEVAEQLKAEDVKVRCAARATTCCATLLVLDWDIAALVVLYWCGIDAWPF